MSFMPVDSGSAETRSRVPERLLLAIVDDEACIRTALRRLISTWDMDVETFESGQAFLDSLGSHRPDCLLLDLHMPGLNGLDVQQELLQRGIALPTIIITAHLTADVRARGLASGVSRFLDKPLDHVTLLEAIQMTLQERNSTQPSRP